jgi:outer membrane protein assembly factor BamB
MSSQQKFTEHTFLKIFILVLFFSTQSVYTQKLENISPGNAIDKTLKPVGLILEELIFTKPLTENWNFSSSNLDRVINASDNDSEIFLSTSNGKIIKINSDDGEKLWESDLGGDTASAPLILEDSIYLTTRPVKLENGSSLILRAINKENGLTEWQTKINSKNDEAQMSFLFSYENNLLVVDNTGTLTALDKENGTIKWSKNFTYTLTSRPFLSGSTIVLTTSEKQFIFVSAKDGDTIYKFPVFTEFSAIYYNSDAKKLIWGSKKGNVSAITLDSRRLSEPEASKTKRKAVWKFKNGAEISEISLTEKGFLISSFDNFLYLISKDKGDLIWKKRLNGRIAAAPMIYKNFIVVINIAEPTASILDLKSGKLVNKISLPGENYFICSPILAKEKLILTTQKGIFAFEANDLKQ